MALDGEGNILLADAGNRRIRLIPRVDARWALTAGDPLPVKPPETYRILLVGDAGLFYNAMADDSIAAELQRELEAARDKNGLGARKVQIETVSLGNADLTTQTQYLVSRVPKGSADLILWSLDTNAFGPFPRRPPFFADERFVGETIQHVATALGAEGTKVVLSMHPVASQVGLDDATYSTYLGPGGGIEGGLQGFQDYERWLGALGVPEIAVSPKLLEAERAPHRPFFGTDDGHLTPEGNVLFARILADGLAHLHPWGEAPPAPARQPGH
jgi:hypothetical protein